MKLIVIHAFGEYSTGSQITDPEKVDEVLASDWAPNVVKVADDPADPPAAAKKAK